MAAISRPQLGSLPAQAVFTRGEWAMALAILSASASVAAPLMCNSTTWVMPSPSATIWRASEVQNCVIGRGVAVHRDAVEADLDGRAQATVQHRRLDDRIRQNVDQHGGVRDKLRMNHSRALAKCGDADFFPLDFKPCKSRLLHRIGGEDGLGGLLKMVEIGAQRCG